MLLFLFHVSDSSIRIESNASVSSEYLGDLFDCKTLESQVPRGNRLSSGQSEVRENLERIFECIWPTRS